MLNSRSMEVEIVTSLWNNFESKTCADGSANRLYDALSNDERLKYIPDFLVGDLDSVRPEVHSFYQHHGTEIVKDDDQDHNDFDKALQLIQKKFIQFYDINSSNSLKKPITVVALGAFGGRFDQEAAAISTLYHWTKRIGRVVLMDRENIIFLLSSKLSEESGSTVTPSGNNMGFIEHKIYGICDMEGPVCGLLPLGYPVEKIWTQGLRWNLNGQTLSMGGLISSSNFVEPINKINDIEPIKEDIKSDDYSIDSELKLLREINVQTSQDVVWSWEIHWPKKDT